MADENVEAMNKLVKDAQVTQALTKLNQTSLEISVYRHTSLVQSLEMELQLIEEELQRAKDSDTKKSLEERKNLIKPKLEEAMSSKIEGILTPLKYRDINDIKAAVTEAVVHFNEYNFDNEVKLSRIIAEERYMTVFCALKKKESIRLKYFNNLEEIALCDDLTISDIYEQWAKHFVLTNEELKN
jgi:hypothetical protein